MGELVYDDSGQMIEWASKIIGFQPRSDAVAVGWREHGELRAVVLYDNFSACDCNMHIASDGTGNWLRRAFLVTCFMHPFVQWRLRRVTGLVPAKNKDALRFDLHLGFKQEGIVRNALPDDDIILLGMFKSECVYLPRAYRV